MSVFGLGYAGPDAGELTRVKRRKKRRVLIIVQNLPVPFDRRVWQEATELTRNGYQVSIICPTGVGCEKREEIINDIHIYRHPLPLEAKGFSGYALEYSLSLFWEFLLAWKVFWREGFDVIHACNPPDNIFLIAGFFKLFGKKFLFDHHDIGPELYIAKFKREDFFYRQMLLWEKLTFRLANISIATNNSYREIAINRGKMKAENVFVVRSGPNLDRIKIMPPNPDLKMGKKFLVGYLGVMGRQEGINYLLDAAEHIVHVLKREDIHFTLIGGGPVLDFMKNLATKKNLDGYVTFTGRIPDPELLAILNTADVCVNSDVFNDMNDKSTMNKIMEYMALGKPIVQFDVTEGRFSAGESSLYAERNNPLDMADKIIGLLANPEKRETMGKFGRTRVESELAWPYEAPKLLAAYEALFSKHRRNANAYDVVLVGPYPEDPAYIKGGVQASVYGLAQTLKKNHQAVKIFSLPLKADGTFRQTKDITYLNAPYKFLFSSLLHLPHVMHSISAMKNPVLHVHGTGFFQATLCAAARIKSWPLVWTLHGITEKETWQRYRDNKTIGNFVRYIFYRMLERLSLRLAPHVIVDTPYVVEALPYAQENPHIIPQGIATQEFTGLAKQNRKSSIILSLGVIDPRKGHHITLEAFAMMRQHVPDAKLVIAGSLSNPFYADYLKEKAKQLRLRDSFEIIPNAPRAKILQLLGEARVMALHSREESQGIALCEAMASGLPVVATYSGGIPYVVEDGETGLLVDYGDVTKFAEGMLRLLTEDDLHERMSAKAYAASAKFEWAHITERISTLYRQALAA